MSGKDTSRVSGNGDMGAHIMNGNGAYTQTNNYAPVPNGINLNLLPNSIMNVSENLMYPININGKLGSQNPSPIGNGHNQLNGNLVNGNGNSGILIQHPSSSGRPKKQVTIIENIQKNREEEEIEESNPTISLLHQQHCPRYDNNGSGVDKDMWVAATSKDEQTKMMLELRERQIQRAEEEIQKLQKDKRSLNHQIGLMKTEMVHMKSQMEDGEKVSSNNMLLRI